LDQLKGEKFLNRSYCEVLVPLQNLLRDHGILSCVTHQVAGESDLIALLEAQLGIAIVPQGLRAGCPLKHVRIDGLDLECTVHAYGVAGRQRTPAASTLLKLLRSADRSGNASQQT
jgi:hypothetical protein